MMDRSDLFRAFVSKKEETIIIGNSDKRIYRFNNQNLKEDEVAEIQLPYAMKLILSEIESMGLNVHVQVR